MTSNPPPPESELSEEFRRLGENLKQAATAAWQSEEAQKFRQELQTGLRALESGLRDAAASPTGQRIKTEAEEIPARVRSGQVENQLRNDLLAALKAGSFRDTARQIAEYLRSAMSRTWRSKLGYLFAKSGVANTGIDRVNAALDGPLSLEATRRDLAADGSATIKANAVNKA